MYSASEWIFLDLWRFINVILLIIITDFAMAVIRPRVSGFRSLCASEVVI